MQRTRRGSHRPPGTSLRVGELTATMAAAVAIGGGVGALTVGVDRVWLTPPPIELGAVASAQSLLSAVAAGLITVAVFSLWMRTVVVGLVSGHFSPRTLVTFLEDRFQRNLLGAMSAGLVAVLVVLATLPESSREGAAPPLLGTLLGAVVGVAGLAAVLVAIQHATRSLSLPELVARLADEALGVLARQPAARVELPGTPPASPSVAVTARQTGWVTDLDVDRVRESLPPGGVAHLRTRVGAFVTPRTPVVAISLLDAEGTPDLEGIAAAVTLGRTRSPDLDLAFAVGQLVDVGVYALGGSTDTATGHEVLVHLGAVLEAVVEHGLPRRHDLDAEGRRVHDEAGWDAADLVQLCAERLRGPAAAEPESARHLLHMLGAVRRVAAEVDDRTVSSEVGRQVESLLALAEADGMLEHDRKRLGREAEAVLAER